MDDNNTLLNIAWTVAALLKLRGYTKLCCPVVSSASWDVIASITDHSVRFSMLDDAPRQIALPNEDKPILLEDLDWAEAHLLPALDLRNAATSKRFALAFEIAYHWNHTRDPRIALAQVWAGLEALFGRRSDTRVSERLGERIAAWVQTVSKEEVKDLYNRRCDAVHGRKMEDAEVWQAIVDSACILRASLLRAIETGGQTLPDE